MDCDCPICTRIYKAKDIARRGDVEELRTLVDDLLYRLINAETDAEYYRSILDGTWPRSIEVLRNSLEKASEKKFKRDFT